MRCQPEACPVPRKRKKYLVDRAFQFKFIGRLLLVLVVNAIATLGCIWLLYYSSYNLLPGNAPVLLDIEPGNIITLKKSENGFIKSNGGQPYIKIDKKPLAYNAFDLYLMPVLFISILNATLLILFAFFMSHRMAGPVLRMKKNLARYLEGDQAAPVSLRKGDHFSDLAGLVNQAIEKGQNDRNENRSLIK